MSLLTVRGCIGFGCFSKRWPYSAATEALVLESLPSVHSDQVKTLCLEQTGDDANMQLVLDHLISIELKTKSGLKHQQKQACFLCSQQ